MLRRMYLSSYMGTNVRQLVKGAARRADQTSPPAREVTTLFCLSTGNASRSDAAAHRQQEKRIEGG